MKLTRSIPAFLCLAVLTSTNAAAQGKTSLQFAFGNGQMKSDWTRVSPTNVYSDAIGKAFVDGTHHNNYGSYELAKCVVEGIRQDELPLAKFIVDDFGNFDPTEPDDVNKFEMPASPNVSAVKPLGN